MKLIYCLQSAQEVLTISYSKLPYKMTSWTDSTKIRIRFQFYCKENHKSAKAAELERGKGICTEFVVQIDGNIAHG